MEPETILEKVAKASGGNFSFHKQTQEHRDTPAGPVVRRTPRGSSEGNMGFKDSKAHFTQLTESCATLEMHNYFIFAMMPTKSEQAEYTAVIRTLK